MDLAFDDMYWLVLDLNRGQGHFLNFLSPQMIYTAKSAFLAVNASFRWLRVLSPGFLTSYWSAGFGTFPQVSALASHWLEDCENFMPTPE
jgi:hypothetical protein